MKFVTILAQLLFIFSSSSSGSSSCRSSSGRIYCIC